MLAEGLSVGEVLCRFQDEFAVLSLVAQMGGGPFLGLEPWIDQGKSQRNSVPHNLSFDADPTELLNML